MHLSKVQFAFAPTDGTVEWIEDARLLVNVKEGGAKSSRSIVELYDALRPSLLAYLSGLGLLREESEDVVQESFLRLLRRMNEGRDEHQPRPWLFRVAHNLAVDYFRSASYKTASAGVDVAAVGEGLSSAGLSPEETAIQQEQWKLIQKAIDRLTPQQKYAVLLRAEGLRYREIAEVLSVSTKRVAELVQRALALLAIQS